VLSLQYQNENSNYWSARCALADKNSGALPPGRQELFLSVFFFACLPVGKFLSFGQAKERTYRQKENKKNLIERTVLLLLSAQPSGIKGIIPWYNKLLSLKNLVLCMLIKFST